MPYSFFWSLYIIRRAYVRAERVVNTRFIKANVYIIRRADVRAQRVVNTRVNKANVYIIRRADVRAERVVNTRVNKAKVQSMQFSGRVVAEDSPQRGSWGWTGSSQLAKTRGGHQSRPSSHRSKGPPQSRPSTATVTKEYIG